MVWVVLGRAGRVGTDELRVGHQHLAVAALHDEKTVLHMEHGLLVMVPGVRSARSVMLPVDAGPAGGASAVMFMQKFITTRVRQSLTILKF